MNKGQKSPRVLVGFAEVAGYYANIFEGFIASNVDAGYINNASFDFEYKYDTKSNPKVLNAYINFCRRYRKQPNFARQIQYKLYNILLLIFISLRYDVFILSCSGTILRFQEFRFLKFFGKKVICVSLGSATRPPYLNGNYKDDAKTGSFSTDDIIAKTSVVKNRVAFFEANSHLFINYPQHAQFNAQPFINGMYIGFPTRIAGGTKTSAKGTCIRILHAPSRPKVKGSHYFRQIIAELKAEGLDLELIELVNKPNAEVLREIQKCDIVLDELYSDMPLGGLGTEAAMFGKPVVVGGYYAELMRLEVDEALLPPSKYVLPAELKAALRELCMSAELRVKIGNDLYNYVANHWSAKVVAQRYLQLISGNFDPRWNYNPEQLAYLEGWGLSRAEVRENILKMISVDGGYKNLGLANENLLSRYQSLVADAS